MRGPLWNPDPAVLTKNIFMDSVRLYGFVARPDRVAFADFTGRLKWIQQAMRRALLNRIREAYLILRRVLPIDIAVAVLGNNVLYPLPDPVFVGGSLQP